jgi:hypothetical protein
MHWVPVNMSCEPVSMSWEDFNMTWELVTMSWESSTVSIKLLSISRYVVLYTWTVFHIIVCVLLTCVKLFLAIILIPHLWNLIRIWEHFTAVAILMTSQPEVHPSLCNVTLRFRDQGVITVQKNIGSAVCGGGCTWTLPGPWTISVQVLARCDSERPN